MAKKNENLGIGAEEDISYSNWTFDNLKNFKFSDGKSLDETQIFAIARVLQDAETNLGNPKNFKSIEKPNDFYSLSDQEQAKFFTDRINANLDEAINYAKLGLVLTKEQIEEIKPELYAIGGQFVSMYANSASTTIKIPDEIAKRPEFKPFSAGAMREIVMTKTLNDDGSYNISYSSKNSDGVVTYDQNGNPIAVSSNAVLNDLAQTLYQNGFNVAYLEDARIYFSKDISGKSPESTVQGWTLRPRTDDNAKIVQNELAEIVDTFAVPVSEEIAEQIPVEETAYMSPLGGTPTEEPVLDNNFATDKLRGSTKGQSLANVSFGDSNGVSQEIDTTKLGTTSNQKFSMVDTGANGRLLGVSSGDQLVAVFSKEKDKLLLSLSKDFVDNFKAQNPGVVLPDVALEDDCYTYEIEQVKLSSNLQIEDIQIKAAGTDFALMFSTLGCQIKDSSGNLGKTRAQKDHFDIIATTNFVNEAFANDSKCVIDKVDPAYSATLISMLQLERKKANGEFEVSGDFSTKKTEPISIKLPSDSTKPAVELYSVPITTADGKVNYLNIKKEGKRTFVYLQITSEKTGRPLQPKFYEVNTANLEATSSESGVFKNPTLYLGVVNSINVPRVNIDLDFNANADSLILLQSILSNEFDKVNSTDAGKKAQKVGSVKLKETEFVVTAKPTGPSSAVYSFDNVAILKKTPVEPELTQGGPDDPSPVPPGPKTKKPEVTPGPTKPEDYPGPIGPSNRPDGKALEMPPVNDEPGSGIIKGPPARGPERTPSEPPIREPENVTEEPPINIAPEESGDGVPPTEPEPVEEPAPVEEPVEEPAPVEEPVVEEPAPASTEEAPKEEKKVDKKKKELPTWAPSSAFLTTLLMVGLSTFLPIPTFVVLLPAFACLGLAIAHTHPLKTLKQWRKENFSREKDFIDDYSKEKSLQRQKEKLTTLQKNQVKVLTDLNAEKARIETDPTLTDAQRAKKLKKIDEKIAKKQADVEATTTKLNKVAEEHAEISKKTQNAIDEVSAEHDKNVFDKKTAKFSAKMSSLEQSKEAMEAVVKQLNAEQTALNQKIVEKTAERNALEAERDSKLRRVAYLRELKNTGMPYDSTQLESLENEILSMNSRLKTFDKDLSNLNTQKSALSDSILGYDDKIAAQDDKMKSTELEHVVDLKTSELDHLADEEFVSKVEREAAYGGHFEAFTLEDDVEPEELSDEAKEELLEEEKARRASIRSKTTGDGGKEART